MKILIVTFTIPPNKDGVSEVASAMARGLLDYGWEVSVLTERLNPPHEQLTWEGADLTEFDYAGTKYRPKVVLYHLAN